MINKKNVLGKKPSGLGVKDAIHVAIVSVRAGGLIKPGQRCDLNEFNEAVPAERHGVGVADPFQRKNLTTGQEFWLLLDQKEVPNVQHVWEHPTVDFSPPTREVQRNEYLERYAKDLGVTYDQLIEACSYVVENDDRAPYRGNLTEEEVEEVFFNKVDRYELWSEWANEVGHEFENYGSDCCPEYDYPIILFTFNVKQK